MKLSHRFQFFEYSKRFRWLSLRHSVYWIFKKKNLQIRTRMANHTVFMCFYISPTPFQLQLYVISASKISSHCVVTGLSCFIIMISKLQRLVTIIHMKPGANETRPFFNLADQLWCIFRWTCWVRNNAVITWQAWCSAIEEIGWK